MGINIPEAELHELVLRRECIPGVERLQTTYCRYAKRGEALASQFWQAPLSRKNYEHHARAEQQHFLLADHPLFTDMSPESVNLKIVQAPAEFALPVKQDRRLCPSFKVKVDMKYKSQISVPITLKAFIVTQHDKDNILSWQPDDMLDQDKKKITELKGTTSITHYFEASSGGSSRLSGTHLGGSSGMDHPMDAAATLLAMQGTGKHLHHGGAGGSSLEMHQPGLPGKAVSPSMLLQIWNSDRSMQQDAAWQHSNLSIKPVDISLSHSAGQLSNLPDTLGISNLPSSSHGLSTVMLSEGGSSRSLQNISSRDLMGSGLLGARGGGEVGVSGEQYGLMGMENWHSSQLQQQQLQAHMLQELQQIQHQQHQQQQLQQLQQQLQHMLVPPPQQQQLQQHQQLQQQQLQLQQHQMQLQQHQLQLQQEQQQMHPADYTTVSHEFEFSNLEFVRPTRMNKVYMLFACTVMDLDLVYVVYNVPTVGICRAEQREKACQKLGMTLPPGMIADVSPHVKQEAAEHGRKREVKETEPTIITDGQLASPEHTHKRQPAGPSSEAMESEVHGRGGVGGAGDNDDSLAVPFSRSALRCWILEQYECTGLTRKLSELDLKALLSQAGFPSEAAPDKCVTVSAGQWEEFVLQFKGIIQLLQQIANVWNLQEPCIISGFDMDRLGTIQALSNEPAGTFICRFSMSQPGCLVLTCKTNPGHACSDKNNLLHAIIKIDDLHERRVDTWIRDFAGATHVLDVYRQKRVDKRKVFASNYTNLRGLGSEAYSVAP